MTSQRQGLGRRGEILAKRHLEALGYTTLETNYRTKSGEIDLISSRDGGLVFFEVRTRRGPGFGSPEESVTAEKRQRLVAVAQEYLQATDNEGAEWRIDLVALEMDSRGRLLRLDVVENAVEL